MPKDCSNEASTSSVYIKMMKEEKILLDELIDLKYRLYACNTGDERFLEQCKEILSSFQTIWEHFPQLVDDSVSRRSLLFCLERWIQLRLEANLFRPLSLGTHEGIILAKIRDSLINISGAIKFSTDKLHFGGSWKRASTLSCPSQTPTTSDHSLELLETEEQGRQNATPYFAICLQLLAFLEANDRREEENQGTRTKAISFFQRFEEVYGNSPSLLIDALMEQDERCLLTLLAVLKISKNQGSELPSMLADPLVLFFHLLKRIAFDPLIVVDWLNSETVAFAFLFAYLKCLNDRMAEAVGNGSSSSSLFREILKRDEKDNEGNDANFQSISPPRNRWSVVHQGPECPGHSVIQASSSSKSRKEEEAPFQFVVDELHGQLPVQKVYTIPRHSTNILISSDQKSTETENREDEANLCQFFSALLETLERCQRSLPANTAPIQRQLRLLLQHQTKQIGSLAIDNHKRMETINPPNPIKKGSTKTTRRKRKIAEINYHSKNKPGSFS